MVNENFSLSEKMAFAKKLDDVKCKISQSSIKKSGKNNFQHYSYFELKDFLPITRKLFNEAGLFSTFEVKKGSAFLTIQDLDSGYGHTWEHRLPKVQKFTVKGNNKSPIKETEIEKTKGALETYARRYLYLAALELTDADPIDNGDVDAEDNGKYAPPETVAKNLKKFEDKEARLTKMVKSGKTTEAIAEKVRKLW